LFDIRWVASDNALIDSVSILLSTDGGSSYPDTAAAGLPNDSSYTWFVPDMDSRTARMKIVAVDGGMNQGADASDADFTLLGTTSGSGGGGLTGAPADWTLEVAGGNPVGSQSKIVLGLPEPHQVGLDLYDVTGRALMSLAHGRLPQGYHELPWRGCGPNGVRLGPGIYFLRLDCGHEARTAKIVIMR
jgi:hypothetical protein